MTGFFWSEAEKNQLADLLRQGLSAGKIAARFEGVSRNAVIGVVHRDPELRKIGLSGRAPRSKPEPARKAPRVSPSLHLRAKRAPAKPRVHGRVDPVAPASLDIALADLNGQQCKWPTNDPPRGEAFTFCGHERAEGAYCAYHAHRNVRHDH